MIKGRVVPGKISEKIPLPYLLPYNWARGKVKGKRLIEVREVEFCASPFFRIISRCMVEVT